MDESTHRFNYKDQYDAEYYNNYGHANERYVISPAIRQTLAGLTGFLISHIKFDTHLDVGCAMGILVDNLRRKGKESFGVDVSEYAISSALHSVKRYVFVYDITSGQGFEQKFDLVTCVEVAEHLPSDLVGDFLDSLCSLSDTIFFSSENNTSEPTHLSPRPLSYWIQEFYKRGFLPGEVKYGMIPWGRIFVKSDSDVKLRDILDKETRLEVHIRDNFKCVLCGKKGVQIHEIVPRSFFGTSTAWLCFAEKNRISLCPKCHEDGHTVEGRRAAIKAMIAKYGYTYEEQFYQSYQE